MGDVYPFYKSISYKGLILKKDIHSPQKPMKTQKIIVIPNNSFEEYKLTCPFHRSLDEKCDHKSNCDKAKHYSFKKDCKKSCCPLRGEFK